MALKQLEENTWFMFIRVGWAIREGIVESIKVIGACSRKNTLVHFIWAISPTARALYALCSWDITSNAVVKYPPLSLCQALK